MGTRSSRTGRGPTPERPGPEDPSVPPVPASADERQLRGRGLCQPAAHAGRHPSECFRLRGRGTRDDDRLTGVAADASLQVDGDRGEAGDIELLAELLAPPPSQERSAARGERARAAPAMFSTIPRMGTFIFRNIWRPFRTSRRDTSWGVVTMTAPDSGRVWESERRA